MSAPAEICDTCGKTITDEDLETGLAIAVLGKSYCPACKAEAMKEISLEDLAKPAGSSRPVGATPRPAEPPTRPSDHGQGKPPARPVPPSASPPPKPPASPARPSADPSPAKAGAGVDVVRLEIPKELPKDPPPQATPRTMIAPSADRRRPPPTRRTEAASKTPLLVAIGAVSLVVAITIIVFPKGGGGPKKGPGPVPEQPDPEGKGPKPPPSESREVKAEKAFKRVDELARVAGTSPDDLLAAVERARPDCRGTPYESKLEEIRKKGQQARDEAEAARLLQPLYDELRKAVVTDPKFQRYAELEEKFRKAKEIALRTNSEKAAEITEFRQDYTRRYEMAAEPYGREIGEAAQILLDEKRYDDALAKIETFPRELRQSGAWRGVERIKQEIERQRKLFPPKK